MGRFGNSLLPAPSQEMEEDRRRRAGVLKGFWGWNQGHASGNAGRFREHRLQDADYVITPGCVRPAAVPSNEKGQRLVFRGSEHTKNRCHGSRLEEERRAAHVLGL